MTSQNLPPFDPGRCLLSKPQILNHLELGYILIDPIDLNRIESNPALGTTSFDIRLGHYYYRQNPNPFYGRFFNPYDPEDVRRLWGQPQQAMALNDFRQAYGPMERPAGLTEHDLVIPILPGQQYLGHSLEFIGGLRMIATSLYTRSNLRRSGIDVHGSSNQGQIDWVNRWTFEIVSTLKVPTFLPVGARVASVQFWLCDPVHDRVLAPEDSKLLLKRVRGNWTPDRMLPALGHDPEVNFFHRYDST